MFLQFANIDERRKYGGSAFVELQYCKLPTSTKLKKLVAVKSINNWQDDSLYIYLDDIDKFYTEYKDIFSGGIYGDLKTDDFDLNGINYYPQEQIIDILEKIKTNKPLDYETLLQWLNKNTNKNGIYILGI